MSAYLVANYRITNPEGYRAYPPAVAPTLAAFGGELVIADFDSTLVEGKLHPVTIVVKFPDMHSARAWYDSAEYRAVLHLRTDNTESSAVFVNGVDA